MKRTDYVLLKDFFLDALNRAISSSSNNCEYRANKADYTIEKLDEGSLLADPVVADVSSEVHFFEKEKIPQEGYV